MRIQEEGKRVKKVKSVVGGRGRINDE